MTRSSADTADGSVDQHRLLSADEAASSALAGDEVRRRRDGANPRCCRARGRSHLPNESDERLLNEIVRGVLITDRGEGKGLELGACASNAASTIEPVVDTACATPVAPTPRVITGASVSSTSGSLTSGRRKSFTASRPRPCPPVVPDVPLQATAKIEPRRFWISSRQRNRIALQSSGRQKRGSWLRRTRSQEGTMRRLQITLGCLLAASLLVGSAAAATAASDPVLISSRPARPPCTSRV